MSQHRFKRYKYDLLWSFFWDTIIELSLEENLWILKTMSQKIFKYCYWSSWCNCSITQLWGGLLTRATQFCIQVVICHESLIPHIVVDPGLLWSWRGEFNTSSHHTMAAVSGYVHAVMEWWLWAAPVESYRLESLCSESPAHKTVSQQQGVVAIRLLTVLRTHTWTEFMHGLTLHRNYKHHPVVLCALYTWGQESTAELWFTPRAEHQPVYWLHHLQILV